MQINGALLPAIAFAATILAGCTHRVPDKTVRKPTPPLTTLTVAEPATLTKEQLDRVKASTAFVVNLEGGAATATATAFCCENPRYLITNKHVVTGTDDQVDDCMIIFDDGHSVNRVVTIRADKIHVFEDATRSDSHYFERDIALIELPEDVVQPLQLGKSEDLTETQELWAVGFPHGVQIRRISDTKIPSPTVHSLHVERLERDGKDVSVVQLGGSPTHGDSGGPVFNKFGDVVGVMQALQGEGESIVYAVPTLAIRHLLTAVREAKGRGTKLWFHRSDMESVAQRENRDQISPTQVSPETGGYYVILGSFRKEGSGKRPTGASVTLEKAQTWGRQVGLVADVVDTDDYDGLTPGLWAVVAGPVADRTQAIEFATQARPIFSGAFAIGAHKRGTPGQPPTPHAHGQDRSTSLRDAELIPFESNEHGFRFDPPKGWHLKSKVRDDLSTMDWTWPGSSTVMIRVNVSPNKLGESSEAAARRIADAYAASGGRDYQLIRLAPADLDGKSGALWEFVIKDKGSKRLHKSDVFLCDSGLIYGFLVQAPTNEFTTWSPLFDRVRGGFALVRR